MLVFPDHRPFAAPRGRLIEAPGAVVVEAGRLRYLYPQKGRKAVDLRRLDTAVVWMAHFELTTDLTEENYEMALVAH